MSNEKKLSPYESLRKNVDTMGSTVGDIKSDFGLEPPEDHGLPLDHLEDTGVTPAIPIDGKQLEDASVDVKIPSDDLGGYVDQGPELGGKWATNKDDITKTLFERMKSASDDYYKRPASLSGRYAKDVKTFYDDGKKIDDAFTTAIGEAKDRYQKTRDKMASNKLWESIIHGLGHLFAGVVGHNTGLDLGGVEFNKTDWDAESDRLLKRLNSDIDIAKRSMSSKERTLQEKRLMQQQQYALDQNDVDRGMRQASTVFAQKRELLNYALEKQRNDIAILKSIQEKRDPLLVQKFKASLNADKELDTAIDDEADHDKLELLREKANRLATQAGRSPQWPKFLEPGFFNSHPEYRQQVMKYRNKLIDNFKKPDTPPGAVAKDMDNQGNWWYIDKDGNALERVK
jgi:hypothetical protein